MLVCSFVFTGFRVDVATPQKLEHGLFAPVFASMIVLVIVIEVMLALSYRNVFWFRYSTLQYIPTQMQIYFHLDQLSVERNFDSLKRLTISMAAL